VKYFLLSTLYNKCSSLPILSLKESPIWLTVLMVMAESELRFNIILENLAIPLGQETTVISVCTMLTLTLVVAVAGDPSTTGSLVT
jgi:hypothetical protein